MLTTICISRRKKTQTAIMEITNFVMVFFALTLSFQVLNAEENNVQEAATKPSNPLESLILNQNQEKNQDGLMSNPLSRVKRQYGPYYGNYYPVPIILPIGFGGFGGGFGGRGFGGRGFGGRGFGGRGGGFGGGRGGRG